LKSMFVITDEPVRIGASPMKRRPEDWCRIHKVVILDPDGWRGVDSPSWDTPIDEDEFLERMSVSTICSSDKGLRFKVG
jgi:hypothetical protein